tara:strand:+ start:16330 stop:17763 length:1434 start_codon:yes stop_codon:yes gene_type:complete
MKAEVSDRVAINDSQLMNVFARMKELRTVKYWVFNNRREAENHLKGALSTYKVVLEGSTEEEVKTLEYGEGLPVIDEAVWDLSLNEFSEPIRIDGDYYVVKLDGIHAHPKYANQNFSYWRMSVEKRVRSRLEKEVLIKFLSGVMSDKSFTIEKRVYGRLMDILSELMVVPDSTKSLQNIKMEESPPSSLQQYLDEPVVRFENGHVWSVRELWWKLYFSPYPINFRSRSHLDSGFGVLLRKLAVLDAVAQYGFNEGYTESEDVQHQLRMWTRYLQSQSIIASIYTSIVIDSTEVNDYYWNHHDSFLLPETRRISEKLFDSRISAVEYIDRMPTNNDGKFHNADGVTQKLVNRDSYGEVGIQVFHIKFGEVGGPIKIDTDKYSVFILLEILSPEYSTIKTAYKDIEGIIMENRVNQIISQLIISKTSGLEMEVDREKIMSIMQIPGAFLVKKSHFPNRFVVPQTRTFPHLSGWFEGLLE